MWRNFPTNIDGLAALGLRGDSEEDGEDEICGRSLTRNRLEFGQFIRADETRRTAQPVQLVINKQKQQTQQRQQGKEEK